MTHDAGDMFLIVVMLALTIYNTLSLWRIRRKLGIDT
jgi:hypothetical protein